MKHIMVLPVIEHARKIWEAGLRAVHAGNAVQSCLKRKENTLTCGGHEYDLDAFDAIYAVGAGKASAAMARPVEEMLRERLKAGIINVKYGHGVPLITIKVNEAGHPVPDEAGVRGTREIVSLLEKATERDLVICLISGGGSALMPCPAKGLTLEDKQSLTVRLLECGANIQEINALRKHLSQVKGGRLAQLAYPATVVSFILSDVIGDDLSSIASGPTFPDSTTFDDCLRILEKYGLKKIIPKPVLEFLERGVRGDITETPKPGAPAFERTQNVIIGNNLMALRGARQKAEELGYNTLIQSDSSSREARELAKEHAALAREISRSGRPLRRPACIISGGETTVTVRGGGLGGRNQEYVLAAALEISGLEDVLILSIGTDGTDGPTEAAGAMADGTTIRRARAFGLDPQAFLGENDSYRFFERLADLIITGPTFTNVMDLRLIIVA